MNLFGCCYIYLYLMFTNCLCRSQCHLVSHLVYGTKNHSKITFLNTYSLTIIIAINKKKKITYYIVNKTFYIINFIYCYLYYKKKKKFFYIYQILKNTLFNIITNLIIVKCFMTVIYYIKTLFII